MDELERIRDSLLLASYKNELVTVKSIVEEHGTSILYRYGDITHKSGGITHESDKIHTVTPILAAIMNGATDVFEYLIDLSSHLHLDYAVTSKDGHNCLILAAIHNKTNIIDTLCQRKFPLENRNWDNYTALMEAAIHNNLDAFKHLYNYGSSIDNIDNNGINSLLAAVTLNHINIVKYIYQLDPEYLTKRYPVKCTLPHIDQKVRKESKKDDVIKLTPFSVAIAHDAIDIIQFMLDNISIEILKDFQSSDNQIPVTLAAKYNSCKTLSVLIEHGFDVNYMDSDGLTPLIFALLMGNTEAFKYLLDNGADILTNREKELNPFRLIDIQIILGNGTITSEDRRDIIDYILCNGDKDKICSLIGTSDLSDITEDNIIRDMFLTYIDAYKDES